jgi:nicotinate-nucleotide adenylyltransferase
MDDAPRRRVGLLGGTFDPPHLGHLVVAEQVRDALDLDEVRLLVAGDPWMKDGVGAARHRVAMAAGVAADDPHLTVVDREVRRDGATYTAETLSELRTEEPDVEWFFLLGADAATSLPRWHRAEEAVALATFVVVGRPGTELDLGHPLLQDVLRVDTPLIQISSTDIRQRVAEGRSIRYLVPPSVHRYIREHGLYGAAHGG